MNFFISLLLLVTLSNWAQNCSKLAEDAKPACCIAPNVLSDPTFDNYVEEYEGYSALKAGHVPIYFADLKENVAGVCHYFRIGKGPIRWGYVEIDQEYWQEMSEKQKANLIFHELGHCIEGREHVPWLSPNECPSSFMNKAVISNYCLNKYYDNYMKEMFFKWEEE